MNPHILTLPHMRDRHLFYKDLQNLDLLAQVIDAVVQFPEGEEIHEVSRIDRSIEAVDQMGAGHASALKTAVFDVVDD